MPPRKFLDFRPSEIVSEAPFELTEVRTAPWRNQHAPCSLAEPRFPEKAWLREARPVRAAHAHKPDQPDRWLWP